MKGNNINIEEIIFIQIDGPLEKKKDRPII